MYDATNGNVEAHNVFALTHQPGKSAWVISVMLALTRGKEQVRTFAHVKPVVGKGISVVVSSLSPTSIA
jgi:hypothetical protein